MNLTAGQLREIFRAHKYVSVETTQGSIHRINAKVALIKNESLIDMPDDKVSRIKECAPIGMQEYITHKKPFI